MDSLCFKLHRAYLISFNLSNVGDIFWIKSERTVSKFRNRKRRLLCCVHLLHKAGAWNLEVSYRSRATTAKKCTKQRYARAKLLLLLLFFFSQSEPIVFLLFAVAIAKLPTVVIQKFCYHGVVTSLLLSIKESIKTKRKAEIVSISVLKLMLHGTIRSVLTVRNNVAMLCCAKSRHLKLYINCHNHEFGI